MSRIALVVDDSLLIRRTVQRFLESRGYTVHTACNGLEGLDALHGISPDLIVTDLIMPKMGGSEFIREVRYRPDLGATRIILVAGRRSVHSSGPTAGADYVIHKDVDLVEQLQFAVDKFHPAGTVIKNKKIEPAAG